MLLSTDYKENADIQFKFKFLDSEQRIFVEITLIRSSTT